MFPRITSHLGALFCASFLLSCGPPPSIAAGADDLSALRARVQRSHADVEATLRLASRLWEQNDRAAATDLLTTAVERVPAEPAYVAALGVALEGSERYMEARARYIDFLRGTPTSDLGRIVAQRVNDLGGKTAEGLVVELMASGRPLAHGFDPRIVVAVLPFEAPAGSDLPALGATELLVAQLRSAEGPLRFLDWELGAAAQAAIGGEDALPAERADSLMRLLGAHHLATATLSENGTGLAVRLRVLHRVSGDTPESVEDSISTTREAYSSETTLVARRVWEMLARLEPGTGEDWIGEAPDIGLPALLALDQGLRASERGDSREGFERLTEARRLAPHVDAVVARAAQEESLLSVRDAPALPIGDALLEFARTRAAMAALWGYVEETGIERLAGPRGGTGEVFGLDRLGSQVFVDLVFRSDPP